jgi:hypothetical protein
MPVMSGAPGIPPGTVMLKCCTSCATAEAARISVSREKIRQRPTLKKQQFINSFSHEHTGAISHATGPSCVDDRMKRLGRLCNSRVNLEDPLLKIASPYFALPLANIGFVDIPLCLR